MLWSLNQLRSYRIRATDDTLGSVEDAFFDDLAWKMRYLVVDTAWLFGRRVLLSAAVLGHPDAAAREFPVALDQEHVRNSPDIDAAQPVSRQQEIDLHGYYGWTPYWGAAAAWIPVPDVAAPAAAGEGDAVAPATAPDESERRDPHLRSGRELIGYAIRATDDSIGQVDDILLEEDGWIVRYLVVDTGTWLPGRKVVLSPNWVNEISWADRSVLVNVTRSEIESSPAYNPGAELGREYEDELHRHYGRKGYWS